MGCRPQLLKVVPETVWSRSFTCESPKLCIASIGKLRSPELPTILHGFELGV